VEEFGFRFFVWGFGRSTRARDIGKIFKRYGSLIKCEISTGRDSPFAFVTFNSPYDAEKVLRTVQRERADLVVEWARSRPPGRCERRRRSSSPRRYEGIRRSRARTRSPWRHEGSRSNHSRYEGSRTRTRRYEGGSRFPQQSHEGSIYLSTPLNAKEIGNCRVICALPGVIQYYKRMHDVLSYLQALRCRKIALVPQALLGPE